MRKYSQIMVIKDQLKLKGFCIEFEFVLRKIAGFKFKVGDLISFKIC